MSSINRNRNRNRMYNEAQAIVNSLTPDEVELRIQEHLNSLKPREDYSEQEVAVIMFLKEKYLQHLLNSIPDTLAESSKEEIKSLIRNSVNPHNITSMYNSPRWAKWMLENDVKRHKKDQNLKNRFAVIPNLNLGPAANTTNTYSKTFRLSNTNKTNRRRGRRQTRRRK